MEQIERLARDLADTRYLSLDPPMTDAFVKLSNVTQDRYRLQASLLIKKGWTDHLKAYQEHVIDQAATIIRHRDIKCMFTTPKLLEALSEKMSSVRPRSTSASMARSSTLWRSAWRPRTGATLASPAMNRAINSKLAWGRGRNMGAVRDARRNGFVTFTASVSPHR